MPHRNPIRLFVFIILAAAGGNSAVACKYCQMRAEDPEAFKVRLPADRTGEARLEAAIDKVQAPAPEPPPMMVATSAADLPATAARRKPAPVIVPLPPKAAPAPVRAPEPGSQSGWKQAHVVDGGLVGLALIGGVFCWRTRRADKDAASSTRT